MHRAMKQLLPDAMFIGFTGTPLLKADKMTSIETFGSFIHTYKFDEAVRDGVVLDLRYEARNVDQELKGAAQVDKWFDLKTQGLTDLSKARLKKRWGTMQKVVSAKSRAEMIVQDILMDFEREPRLISGRGNAMLVGDSIYQACKFYELFAQAGFKGKVAIVTSYVPNATGISKEDAGEGDNEELRKYDIYRQMLADYFNEPADKAVLRIEEFEKEVKRRFIEEPGQMRLLIVVDKLLTGFDAPSATYLYIDKKMRDHGLFQAICRVNRLDGDDKTYGYVIDYRDLFKSLDKAITDYTSGALDGYAKEDVEGLLEDRIEQEREDLDEALETVRALCEPVAAPKGTLEYQHYFVASVPGDADADQGQRAEARRAVQVRRGARSRLRRARQRHGPRPATPPPRRKAIKDEVAHFVAVKNEVELGAGENIDMKQFEAGMRALLDTYIQADPVEQVATFDKGLVQLIVERGADALDTLPDGHQEEPRGGRRDDHQQRPQDDRRRAGDEPEVLRPHVASCSTRIIEQRRQDAIDYADYLAKLLEHAEKVGKGESEAGVTYPDWAKHAGTAGARRLRVARRQPTIDVEQLHDGIQSAKEHGWAGNPMKERALARELRKVLPGDFDTERLSELIDLLKEHDEYR